MTDARPTIDAMRFRKRPVVIEAFQLTRELIEAHLFDKQELPFGVCSSTASYHSGNRTITHCSFSIETPEGRVRARQGDWIIRFGQGELYPCKPDTFEASYEPAPSEPQPPLNDEGRADLARIAENPTPADAADITRLRMMATVAAGLLSECRERFIHKHATFAVDPTHWNCIRCGTWGTDEKHDPNCLVARIDQLLWKGLVAGPGLVLDPDAEAIRERQFAILDRGDRATLLSLLDSRDATIAGLTAELAGKGRADVVVRRYLRSAHLKLLRVIATDDDSATSLKAAEERIDAALASLPSPAAPRRVEPEPEETFTCDRCGKKAVPDSEGSHGDGVFWCNDCCYDAPSPAAETK